VAEHNDERDLALRANIAGFDRADEIALLVSPHLRHQQLRRLHRRLISLASESAGSRLGTMTVLELGAGDGLGSAPWFELGVGRIVAVDPSPVMLERFAARAAASGIEVELACTDADRFFETSTQRFDIVSFASVLHHIPDYLPVVRSAMGAIRPGGSLVIFQDPLRYDTMPRLHHRMARVAFLAWRLTRGNYRRGLRTFGRRLRGVYAATEPSDYEEYHAVRNGVDSTAVVGVLEPEFNRVQEFRYWSTPAKLFQVLGEALGLKTEFGIVATRRRG
jgi:2-polyprenyl-3-methyl-5-hydroxy-6-metoxy-1,4-benzoquinol methylase